MTQDQATGVEHAIEPDQISHIEISSQANGTAQVRVFVNRIEEPSRFDFPDKAAAVEFYKHLWSLRTVDGDENVVMITA